MARCRILFLYCLLGACDSVRSIGNTHLDAGAVGADARVAVDAQRSPDDASPDAQGADAGLCEGSACAATGPKLALGWNFSCVLRDGEVHCWGDFLGDSSTDYSGTPTQVILAAPAKDIASGTEHVCALLEDDSIWCWGEGTNYQLGGSWDSTVPRQMEHLAKVEMQHPVALAASAIHACTTNAAGEVACWGTNSEGQASPTDFTVGLPWPTRVTVVDSAASLALGAFHSCARTTTGTVRCWGDESEAQLGGGSQNDDDPAVTIPGLTQVAEIQAGQVSTCARRTNGQVACWGNNAFEQLGRSSMSSRVGMPVAIAGLPAARSLASKFSHSCIATTDGEVWCWGLAATGQIDGRTDRQQAPPTRVPGITNAVSVGVGMGHSCAVVADGTIFCWGSDDCGQLGQGSSDGDCQWSYGESGAGDVTRGPGSPVAF